MIGKSINDTVTNVDGLSSLAFVADDIEIVSNARQCG
jgi:hypothetical protein